MVVYDPTKAALQLLWERLVKGAVVVVDDYNSVGGATRAIDAFISDKDIKLQKLSWRHRVNFLGTDTAAGHILIGHDVYVVVVAGTRTQTLLSISLLQNNVRGRFFSQNCFRLLGWTCLFNCSWRTSGLLFGCLFNTEIIDYYS